MWFYQYSRFPGWKLLWYTIAARGLRPKLELVLPFLYGKWDTEEEGDSFKLIFWEFHTWELHLHYICLSLYPFNSIHSSIPFHIHHLFSNYYYCCVHGVCVYMCVPLCVCISTTCQVCLLLPIRLCLVLSICSLIIDQGACPWGFIFFLSHH